MIADWVQLINARRWMKKNVSFLYAWHAYVGYELKLYNKFRKWSTAEEIAAQSNISIDLLLNWLEVGVTIGYLHEKNGRYRTKRRKLLPKGGKTSSGILLKEMMELHIPTLLSYPELMRNQEKKIFDKEEHGPVVAGTSQLLEALAYSSVQKLARKHNAKTILDVGCGYGGYLAKLGQELPETVLVGLELQEDVASETKKRVKEQGNITIHCADVMSWNPSGQKYDLIMLHNLFHYFEPSKRPELIKRVTEWLAEDGAISIISPLQNTRHGKMFSAAFNSFFSAHQNLFPLPDEEEIESIAKINGLSVEHFEPIIKEGSWYSVAISQEKSDQKDEKHEQIS